MHSSGSPGKLKLEDKPSSVARFRPCLDCEASSILEMAGRVGFRPALGVHVPRLEEPGRNRLPGTGSTFPRNRKIIPYDPMQKSFPFEPAGVYGSVLNSVDLKGIEPSTRAFLILSGPTANDGALLAH